MNLWIISSTKLTSMGCANAPVAHPLGAGLCLDDTSGNFMLEILNRLLRLSWLDTSDSEATNNGLAQAEHSFNNAHILLQMGKTNDSIGGPCKACCC